MLIAAEATHECRRTQSPRTDYGNCTVIKALLALLGRSEPVPATRKSRAAAQRTSKAAAHKPRAAGADFRGVVICSGFICCQAARDAAGQRHLMRAAPRLPLAGCSTPQQCACKFKKSADRRDADRRLLGGNAMNRWYAGIEKRSRASRRLMPGY